jgi:glycosyltransferase involved in cell wall biosynthesis
MSKGSGLRIGLDVTLLGSLDVLGTRHWTRGAFAALMRAHPEHRYTLIWSYPSTPSPQVLELCRDNRELFVVRPPLLWRRVARKLGLVSDLARCLRHLRHLDVIHWNLLTEGCFAWLHRLPDVPKVITAYDAIARVMPESLHPNIIREWTRHYDRARELGSWWIAISDSARDDMIKYYHFDPSRGRTIYPGHNFDGTGGSGLSGGVGPPARLGLADAPYLLDVCVIAPHKNHLRLVRTFRQLIAQPRFARWKLVLVGQEGWFCDPIVAEIDATPGVIRAGRLSHEELAATYRHAALFVFPSLYEGFGLPVAEAMSFGLPVVTSNVSSLPEAAGPAGVLVNPYDEEEMRTALERLMADPDERRRRGEAGRDYVRQFTWNKAAGELMQFLEEVAGSRRAGTVEGRA